MSQGEDDIVLVLQGQYELMTGHCDKATVRSVVTKGYCRTVVTLEILDNFVYNKKLQHKQHQSFVFSLQKAVSLNEENGEAQHHLARMYWIQAATDQNKRNLCFQTLLKVNTQMLTT